MNAQLITEISAAIVQLNSGAVSRSQVEAAIEKPLSIGLLPEELYLLASLFKHLERQAWVAQIVESHLHIRTAELGSKALGSLPDSFPRKGVVPTEPAWAYYFHGKGCCLTHSDGTEIDVDFSADGSASLINCFFYSNHLKSTANRLWYEPRREKREHLAEAWRFDLAGLKQDGLLDEDGQSDSLRLTNSGEELAQSLQPLLESIPNADPLGMVCRYVLLGDWIKAQETAVISGEYFQGLSQLSENRRAERLASLRLKIASASGMEASYAMAAMARFPQQEICADVLDAIACVPASSLNLAALEVLQQWNYSDWKSYLLSNLKMHSQAIWGKSKTAEEWDYWVHADAVKLTLSIVNALIGHEQCEGMKHEDKALLCAVLKNDFGPLEAEAGSLLYLLDTKDGLIKLGVGLFSPVPLVRGESAVYLAIINTDLSIMVLQQGGDLTKGSGYHESAFGFALSGRSKTSWAHQDVLDSDKESNFVWQCMKHDFELKQVVYKTLLEKWNSPSVMV